MLGRETSHGNILHDDTNPRKRAAVKKCLHDMVDRALEMDGTCTVGLFFAYAFLRSLAASEKGEHGLYLGEKESLVKELGMDTIDVMRSIKSSLDPYWLMDPRKIFEATRVDTPRMIKATAATILERPKIERKLAEVHSWLIRGPCDIRAWCSDTDSEIYMSNMVLQKEVTLLNLWRYRTCLRKL